MADDKRVTPAPYNIEDFSNLSEAPYSVLYRESGRDAESFPFSNPDNSHFVEVMPTGTTWRRVHLDLNPKKRLIVNEDGSVSIMADSLPKTGFFQQADLDFDRLTGWGFTAAAADATEDDFNRATFRKPEKIEYELVSDGNSYSHSSHGMSAPVMICGKAYNFPDNHGFRLVPKRKFITKDIIGDDVQKKYPQLNVDYIVGLIHPAGKAGGQITSFTDWINLVVVYNPIDPTRVLVARFLREIFAIVVDATPANLRDLTKLRLLMSLTAAGDTLSASEDAEMNRLAELLLSTNRCDVFTREVLTLFAGWGLLDSEVLTFNEVETAVVASKKTTGTSFDEFLAQYNSAASTDDTARIETLFKSLADDGNSFLESERITVSWEDLNLLPSQNPQFMSGFLPYPGEFPNPDLMAEWKTYPFVLDISDDETYMNLVSYLANNTNLTTGPLEFVDWLHFQITDNAERLKSAFNSTTDNNGQKINFIKNVPNLIQYFDQDFLFNDVAWQNMLEMTPETPEIVFYAYAQAYSHAGRDIHLGLGELWLADINRDNNPDWNADSLMLKATAIVGGTESGMKDHHAIIEEALLVLTGSFQDETRLAYPFLYELVAATRSEDPSKVSDVLITINDRYLVPLGYAIEVLPVQSGIRGMGYLPVPVKINGTQSREFPNFKGIHATAYFVEMANEEFPELTYLHELDGVEALLNSHANPHAFLKRYKKDRATKTIAGPVINRDFVKLVASDTLTNLPQNYFRNIVDPNLSEDSAYEALLTDCAAHETGHIEDIAVQQAYQERHNTVPDFNEIYATLLGIAGSTDPKLSLVLRADLFVHNINGKAVIDLRGALSRHGIGATYFFIQLARELELMTSVETFVTMHEDLQNGAERFDSIMNTLVEHLKQMSDDGIRALAERYADEYREYRMTLSE